jgi:methionyl-tRNA formyltransferase
VVEITPDDNEETLFVKCALSGTELLLCNLEALFKGTLESKPQDEAQATHARMLTKQDGLIDFSKPATEILQLIKGIIKWPVAHTFIDNKILKIYSAEVINQNPQAALGCIFRQESQGIYVRCGNESLLIKEVQLEGKKRMSASEFARGYVRNLPVQLGKTHE